MSASPRAPRVWPLALGVTVASALLLAALALGIVALTLDSDGHLTTEAVTDTLGRSLPWLGGMVGAPALALGALTWWRATRVRASVRRRTEALRALVHGQPAGAMPPSRGPFGELDLALEGVGARIAALEGAGAAHAATVTALIGPLALPAAVRADGDIVTRNDACQRLLLDAVDADRRTLDSALVRALAGSGAVAHPLELSDGRRLEVEAWSLPGGRIVTIVDRAEQARLAAVRRAITGAGARTLRPPLARIAAAAQRMADDQSVDHRADVAEIRAAVRSVDALVDRLLEAGDHAPDGPSAPGSQTRLAAVAFALGARWDERLRQDGLRLEHDLAEGVGEPAVDPDLLHRALDELVANAAAATPRGGTITLRARRSGAGPLALTVADTGAGIPAAQRSTVREPFVRGAVAPARPGAGLGLSVAAALAGRMGGRLTLPDGPGGLVRLELPVLGAEPALDTPAPAPEADRAGDGIGSSPDNER